MVGRRLNTKKARRSGAVVGKVKRIKSSSGGERYGSSTTTDENVDTADTCRHTYTCRPASTSSVQHRKEKGHRRRRPSEDVGTTTSLPRNYINAKWRSVVMDPDIMACMLDSGIASIEVLQPEGAITAAEDHGVAPPAHTTDGSTVVVDDDYCVQQRRCTANGIGANAAAAVTTSQHTTKNRVIGDKGGTAKRRTRRSVSSSREDSCHSVTATREPQHDNKDCQESPQDHGPQMLSSSQSHLVKAHDPPADNDDADCNDGQGTYGDTTGKFLREIPRWCEGPLAHVSGTPILPPPMLHAVKLLGFSRPTPVQLAAIPPAIVSRKDIVAAAETGSGKTLAYIIPILTSLLASREHRQDTPSPPLRHPSNTSKPSRPHPRSPTRSSVVDPRHKLRAMVIVPTRELAVQVDKAFTSMTANSATGIQHFALTGGLSVLKQQRLLNRKPQIVIGTPGRLHALVGTESIRRYMDLHPPPPSQPPFASSKDLRRVAESKLQKRGSGVGRAPSVHRGKRRKINADDDEVEQSAETAPDIDSSAGHAHMTDLSALSHLVLDEADRLAAEGHFKELTDLMHYIYGTVTYKEKLQTFVTSATLSLPKTYKQRLTKIKPFALLMQRVQFRSNQVSVLDLTRPADVQFQNTGTERGPTGDNEPPESEPRVTSAEGLKGSEALEELAKSHVETTKKGRSNQQSIPNVSLLLPAGLKIYFRRVLQHEKELFLSIYLLRHFEGLVLDPKSGISTPSRVLVFVNSVTYVQRLVPIMGLLLGMDMRYGSTEQKLARTFKMDLGKDNRTTTAIPNDSAETIAFGTDAKNESDVKRLRAQLSAMLRRSPHCQNSSDSIDVSVVGGTCPNPNTEVAALSSATGNNGCELLASLLRGRAAASTSTTRGSKSPTATTKGSDSVCAANPRSRSRIASNRSAGGERAAVGNVESAANDSAVVAKGGRVPKSASARGTAAGQGTSHSTAAAAGITGKVDVMGIHAGLKQKNRMKIMERFSAADRAVLICTDVAARGIDVDHVDLVVHFQAPRVPSLFVHRSGRTARAEANGEVVCLACPEEESSWQNVFVGIGRKIESFSDHPTMEGLSREQLSDASKRLKLAISIEAWERRVEVAEIIASENARAKRDEDELALAEGSSAHDDDDVSAKDDEDGGVHIETSTGDLVEEEDHMNTKPRALRRPRGQFWYDCDSVATRKLFGHDCDFAAIEPKERLRTLYKDIVKAREELQRMKRNCLGKRELSEVAKGRSRYSNF